MLLISGCTQDNNKQTSKLEEKTIVYEGNYESSYATKVDPKSLYTYASNCFEAKVIAIGDDKVNEAGVIKYTDRSRNNTK